MLLEGLLVLGAGGVVRALRKRSRARDVHEASDRNAVVHRAAADRAGFHDQSAQRQARQNAHDFARRTHHTIQSNNTASQHSMSNFMSGMQNMNRPPR